MKQPKQRSCKIGLYLFPEETWMNGETARWDDIKTMAQTAEDIGFDALWLPDRLLFVRDDREQGLWESLTMLAAITAVGPKMMRLAALYADMWSAPVLANTPQPYEKFQGPLDAVCTEVGRDPSTLARMAIMGIDPTAGSQPTHHPYGESLAGPPEEITRAICKFPEAGFTHVVLFPYPNTPAAVEACAPVLEAFDQQR